MEEFLDLSIDLHVSFIIIAIGLALLNIYILKGENAKRKFLGFLPLYYVILTSLAFTGLILIGFIQNIILVSSMVISWLIILIGTIKCYKLAKSQKVLSEKSLDKMRKKYFIDIGIYLLFFLLERF